MHCWTCFIEGIVVGAISVYVLSVAVALVLGFIEHSAGESDDELLRDAGMD